MRQLFTIFLFFGVLSIYAQSPHGADLKMDCAACHKTDSWEIPSEYWQKETEPRVSKTTGMVLGFDTLGFYHDKTDFPLEGQHAVLDCRSCHETLVFSQASSDCISCHMDMHQQTLGTDCARCHTPENWLVANISELHENSGFPLVGVHSEMNCIACHSAEPELRFDWVGNECINCHLSDFQSTTNPDHTDAGFSTECMECHRIESTDWATEELNHDFFPLTLGHEINECASCHVTGDYASTSPDCISCHQENYSATQNPNHEQVGFPTDCASCHTTDPGWMPAEYLEHDVSFFPIYSGAHDGEWAQCVDCHTDVSNFEVFSCTVCHINPETDEGHDGVGGYVYESIACLACHPNGDTNGAFDHDQTNFPLTGAHLTTACLDCHTNGFEGTPTECIACHNTEFAETVNPNHNAIGIPTDCAMCHTTDPGWIPAGFPIHDDYYILNGAHAIIATECISCHNGDYNNTPNTCNGCHNTDYNQTVNPDHEVAQFPTDCASCHGEDAWVPSTFDHDVHYLLTGEHLVIADDCFACHNGDYTNTPNTCVGCHTVDFDQTLNPNHTAIAIPTDCAMCHTTDPDWMPAAFPIHDDYYVLNGAHQVIADDCVACHNGDYNNTPNTCVGCHLIDYNQTTNPDHQAAQFSTDCITCHSEDEWIPVTFDHDGQYFPIYSGAHDGEWSQCLDCHTNPTNFTEFTCVSCHMNPETDDQHPGVGGYVYNSSACLACHPTGTSDNVFDHNTTNFPLTGAHLQADCLDCHSGGYEGTPMECMACHTPDYDQTVNPNHNAVGISTDCAMCHTTEPGWTPADFPIHDDYYVLNGAHLLVANDCIACHNGDYNNTPNTCNGCHQTDYDQTTNPDHALAQFPVSCETCHTEDSWVPSTFDHDVYYPLTGEHLVIADDCVACHNGDYSNTPNTCQGCHTPDYNQSTNPNHNAIGIPTDCAMCHTTEPDWMPADFPIHDDYYVLNGAHTLIANDCVACHNGDYNNTPNTCYGCHAQDYNQTTNPDHQAAQFSTDCVTCHSEDEWIPVTFDHDSQYFPIYSGAHDGEWDQCLDCHTNPTNFAEFTCVTCHMNPETDMQHDGVGGYSYNSTACLACHPTGTADNVFDHNTTSFPLTGAHLMADCLECHSGGYAGTPTECMACHTPDYDQTANPNHNALGISTDCAMCHTTEPGWTPADFPIHDDYYVLNGAHIMVAGECVLCHNGDYNNTPNTCTGCHQTDYDQTTNPDHALAQFPVSCETCHTEDAWIPATFDHDVYYPLTGEHLVIADDCVACHNGDYSNTPNTCDGCHTPDYNQTTNPDHGAIGLPMACDMCHTTEAGWMPADFPIHDDYYVLNGAHVMVAGECVLCHNGDYNNTPNTCTGCHQTDYDQTTNPDHTLAQFPVSCETCHTEDAWIPSTFDHDAYYPIVGAHTLIADDCVACHDGNYSNTPNTCDGCHLTDYNQTTNPDHQLAQFPLECTSCHSQDAWIPATFDHDIFYPLTGAHALIADDCAACHIGGYNNTPNTCAGCHTPDYSQTVNPNHQTLSIPMACDMCHTTDPGWIPADFPIHDDYYVLNGAHALIADDCVSCHNGDYNNTPNTCYGCHLPDYSQTTNPDHQAGQFPIDCESCHSEDAWVPSTFDHSTVYPLTGAHALIADDCATCHNGDYNNTPNTCAGCHTPDYSQTVNPSHTAIGIPMECDMCHTTEPGWIPADFPIHDDYYELNGAHVLIADECVSCHNGDYNNTPNTCFGCHLADYNQTMNPDHQVNQFPINCESCHSEDAWVPSTFDHDVYYSLVGAHALIADDCFACHNGDYNNTPNTCVGCHIQDYNQTINPNHQANQFPINCESCHTEVTWVPATFDHDWYYPLTGEHQVIADDCFACHNGDYNNTPNTCVGCHSSDYNQTTNPDHQSIGIPVDCAMCHTTDPDWMPADFPIHDNYYVLNGAHAQIADQCVLCHNGNYNTTPNTCFGCHASDYNMTTNPNHQSAQFPTSCEACHSEVAWVPATFDHDDMYFPIYSGKHKDEWDQCIECHLIPGDFTSFSCIDCHEHDNQNQVDDDHDGVSGYIYESNACYACHPDGSD